MVCPTTEELQYLRRGELDAAKLEEVLDHLSNCDLCEKRMEELESNPSSLERRIDLLYPRRYVNLDRIGGGGMGEVYKASDRYLNRVVALKVIHPKLLESREAELRFEKEIATLGKISQYDKFFVKLLDTFLCDGKRVLVMSFIPGSTLSQILKDKGPMEIIWACRHIRQAFEGLAFAHQVGVFHCDLKPSNLILDETPGLTPEIKILDFGISRIREPAAGDHSTLSACNDTLGTLDYMAPEQLHDRKRIDARTDIYGLGATLFHLLTGRPPYSEFQGILKGIQIISDRGPPSVNSIVPACPKALSDVIAKMLAKDPEDRYQSATDAARALLPFCSEQSSPMAIEKTQLLQPIVNASDLERKAPKNHLARSLTILTVILGALFYIALRQDFAANFRMGQLTDDESLHAIQRLRDLGATIRIENTETGAIVDLSEAERFIPENSRVVGVALSTKPKAEYWSSLASLKDLKRIAFYTRLDSDDYRRIGRIHGLQNLTLYDANDDAVRQLANVKEFLELNLSSGQITDQSNSVIAQIRKLESLNLSFNPGITSLTLEVLPETLKSLCIAHTSIVSSDLVLLKRLPLLGELSLSENQLDERSHATLGGTAISTLNITDCSSDLQMITLPETINQLSLSFSTEDIPNLQFLQNQKNLRGLHIQRCYLNAEVLTQLADLPKLKAIYLYAPKISSQDLQEVRTVFSKRNIEIEVGSG